jgi:cation diffusion facilitator CzcD-associated flavoprotein CzcO
MVSYVPMSTSHHRVVIVGTGFSGLGMAIRLSQRGEDDYVLLEKAGDVGGTWRDNRYPGCACDVPSRLYSFSFDQKPDWSRDFATAGEIWDYLRDCADRYDVRRRVRFGADLREAAYDEEARRWTLTASDGRQWTCDALVLGVGALHQPVMPLIPGLERFGGPVMHSALWPEHDGLDGKRVAVVGTGASSVQMVPALAPRAERVTVFQRTPAWILPKRDRPWSETRKRIFARHPALQRAVRWATYWELESRVLAFARFPAAMRLLQRYALRHLEKSVSDPQTRAALTPDYTIGCKRILLSNDYWAAFERDDVDLVTDRIERVEPGAVVTADGARHEVDALALGTGFSLSGSFDRLDIRGLGGRSMADAWGQGMHTHLGITVAGFPELYILLGPNTGLGHNSVVLMIEFATRYVLECLDRARSGPHVTTGRAQARFTQEMLTRSRHTVWASGCRSWYLDRFGNNTAVWPGSTLGYWWRTRRVDDSVFVPVAPAPVTAPTEPTTVHELAQ